MKRLNRFLAVLAVMTGLALAPSGARAQGIPVFDASSFAQLLTTVQQGATEVSNLEQQLTAQLNMLKSLPSNIMPGVGNLAQQTQQLMQQLNSIQNMGTSLQSQISSLYPTNFSNLNTVSGVLSELSQMTATTRSAYQQSMQLQNQVAANAPQIASAVQSANAASMAAAGPTAAIQASNQLLGTLSTQLGDHQAILVATYRAQEQQQLEAQSDQQAEQQALADSLQDTPPANVAIPNPFPEWGN